MLHAPGPVVPMASTTATPHDSRGILHERQHHKVLQHLRSPPTDLGGVDAMSSPIREEEAGPVIEDQETVVLPVLNGAESEEGGKERKEKHKKDKKHKHKQKHKHKSGHKRRREEEDGAEVETVHADVTRTPDPARLADGKVPHDVADKAGSDCESGEIPKAEDTKAQALESKAADDRQGLPENVARPHGTDKHQIPGHDGSDRYVWRAITFSVTSGNHL